ncbi:TBC1 domain family member 2B [Pteropus alecto]|uniref:TBC1 domain family member 2B n=1 Tax=Pteropus alecto TaxID=9402 RepID=L5L507_PTEAL|nr:TBC1 domain family member 2B [Pteropus alecto]
MSLSELVLSSVELLGREVAPRDTPSSHPPHETQPVLSYSQDALPLGHLDIADACFSYQGPDDAAEPGAEPPAHFEVHSAGAVTVLKAPNRQLMTYWLQELQQKRWEYCNGLDMVKCDSRAPPTPGDFAKGLVARDSADFTSPHPNPSAEKARNVLAVETAPGELVGEQAASQPAPGHPNSINFSLKQWGTELNRLLWEAGPVLGLLQRQKPAQEKSSSKFTSLPRDRTSFLSLGPSPFSRTPGCPDPTLCVYVG